MGTKAKSQSEAPLSQGISKTLHNRPTKGYYTLEQAAKVWGVRPGYAYELMQARETKYMKATVKKGVPQMIVIPMFEVWEMSDYLDTIRPRYKRRRRGSQTEDPVMPTMLARSSASPELKETIRSVRDFVNDKQPKGHKYTQAVVMWNIMACAAQGVLDRLRAGENVWEDWEYVRSRPPKTRPSKSRMAVPRPMDIPDWVYMQEPKG